jgi:ubiquinone biosynthesis protein COQ9
MTTPTDVPSDLFLARLTDAMLVLAGDAGWTRSTLDAAARAAGLTPGEAILAAPDGVSTVLRALAERAARAAGEAVADPAVARLKVREKVKAGVMAWIGTWAPHRAAVKRAAGSPASILAGPGGLWAASDAIWSGLGDKSTDYNWYTKRMTLVAVLGSTFTAWMADEDPALLDAFLDRRIENVMQIETLKAEARKAFANLPHPLDILGRAGR